MEIALWIAGYIAVALVVAWRCGAYSFGAFTMYVAWLWPILLPIMAVAWATQKAYEAGEAGSTNLPPNP